MCPGEDVSLGNILNVDSEVDALKLGQLVNTRKQTSQFMDDFCSDWQDPPQDLEVPKAKGMARRSSTSIR